MSQGLALLMALLRPARRAKYLSRALQDGARIPPAAFIELARRFGIATVEARYLDAYDVRLDLNGRSITEAVLAGGAFQDDLFATFAGHLDDRSVAFVNVGANVGTTCLNAHHAGFRDIVAFEPVAANYRLLTENLARLPGCRVETHRIALGPAAEERRIFINPASTGRHSLVRDFGHGAETVAVRPLDDVAPPRPAALWIDAEGFEAEILRGAERFLAERCRALCLEVTPALLRPGDLDYIDEVGRRHFRRVVGPEGEETASVLALDGIRQGRQTDVILLP
jgi:FkbM family methyltransferase